MLDIGVNAIEEVHQGTSAFETLVRNHKDHFIVDGQRAVPKQVCDMMLGYWEVDPAESVAVLFSPELAIRAIVAGYTDVTYVGINITEPTRAVFADLSIKCATLEEFKNGMRFDFGLVNPPYSEDQGNKLLYPEFFKLCLDTCDDFVMVMPVNLESKTNKLKSHNHLLKKHSYYISEEVNDYFKVGIGSIRYVFASEQTENEVEDTEEIALPIIMPERDRIKTIGGVGVPVNSRGSGRFIEKVHKDGIVEARVKLSDAKKFETKYKRQSDPSKKWIVLVNHTPSRGLFNTEIVKYEEGLSWSRWVFGIQTSTKEEAKNLVKHLRSDTIVEYLRTNMPSHTVSKKIIESLPGL